MKLTSRDIDLLLNLAKVAAQKAGLIIAQFLDKEIKVEQKTGGESLASQVVTEVDLLSQKTILEILEMTFIPYDLALLTEESEDDKSRLEKDYFWCIDPLDGTLPFTERTNGFAVSIALVSRTGEPIIGVLYDPITKHLYASAKGQGVTLNGQSWNPILDKENKFLTLVCDRSFLKQNNYEELKTKLETIAGELGCEGLKVINHGGAAMNAIWVIENAPACYFKLLKDKPGGGSLWDYAATACIFKEFGLPASDMFGEALDLNRKDSTFMNHKGALYASDLVLAEKIKLIS